jgi:ribosomal protein S18 acetylase RimI-like enzyme
MKNKAPGTPILRRARPQDLEALLALEEHLFATDRIPGRSFRRFVASPSAVLTVAERDRDVIGYVLVLFRKGSALARLYSIAVARKASGGGIGRALLAAAELAALRRGCARMRLEVKTRNRRAGALYRRSGYRKLVDLPGYYADGADAARYEKVL